MLISTGLIQYQERVFGSFGGVLKVVKGLIVPSAFLYFIRPYLEYLRNGSHSISSEWTSCYHYVMNKKKKIVIGVVGAELLYDWLMGRGLSLSFDGEHMGEKSCLLISKAFGIASTLHPDDYRMLHAMVLLTDDTWDEPDIKKYINRHLPSEMQIPGIEEGLRMGMLNITSNYKPVSLTEHDLDTLGKWCSVMQKKAQGKGAAVFSDFLKLTATLGESTPDVSKEDAEALLRAAMADGDESFDETIAIALNYRKGLEIGRESRTEPRPLTEEEFEDLEGNFDYDDSDVL